MSDLNILRVFKNAVNRKLKPTLGKINSKLRMSVVKSRIAGFADRFFTKSMNFKPQNEKDYYGVGRWLVSKKLALFGVILVGIIGLYYFTVMSPVNFFSSSSDGIRVYSYKSVPLRFVSGTVKIKSKNGDIAYVGQVSKGMANGDGVLYYNDATVMYKGMFKNNQYNGTGTLYYGSGMMHYDGDFVDNQPEGKVTSYRENGSREYAGDFKAGLPEGLNEYYDSSSNLIYKGTFSKGVLLYTDLLGKNSTEISEMYTGSRKIYFDENTYMVVLEDINAVYGGDVDQNPLEDSVSAEDTYVMQSECYLAGKVCSTISEIKELIGEPTYEGNTYLNMAEIVALNNSPEALQGLKVDAWMETVSTVNDVYQVMNHYIDQLAYIYSFEYEGIRYTFYCSDRDQGFVMYMLHKCD